MAEFLKSKPASVDSSGAIIKTSLRVSPTCLVKKFLTERLQPYRELCDLKRKVSHVEMFMFLTPCGSKTGCISQYLHTRARQRKEEMLIFRNSASEATTPTPKKATKHIFGLMRTIDLELDETTSGLTIRRVNNPHHAILDLCIAPGGFATAALERNPSALLRGISLPPPEGGHKMMFRRLWSAKNENTPIFVDFRDITLLADELGVPVETVPSSHPDAALFSSDRPFAGQEFDLAFCDGQVLRTHERGERKSCNVRRIWDTKFPSSARPRDITHPSSGSAQALLRIHLGSLTFTHPNYHFQQTVL